MSSRAQGGVGGRACFFCTILFQLGLLLAQEEEQTNKQTDGETNTLHVNAMRNGVNQGEGRDEEDESTTGMTMTNRWNTKKNWSDFPLFRSGLVICCRL